MDAAIVTFTTTSINFLGVKPERSSGVIINTAQDSYSFSPIIKTHKQSITYEILADYKSIFLQEKIDDIFKSKQQEYGKTLFEEEVLSRLNTIPIDGPKIIDYADFATDLRGAYYDFIQAYLKYFREPVVLVHADMFNVHILTAVPTLLGLRTVWKIKQAVVKFKSLEAFIKRIKGSIEPFMAIDLPLGEIYNILFNTLNLKTAKTTDPHLQDILRAIYMELFIEAVRALKTFELEGGTMIITGDYPSMMSNIGQVHLSLFDGFVMKGTWGVFVDTDYIVPGVFTLWKKMGVINPAMFVPYIDVVYIPLSSEPQTVNVGKDAKNYMGIPDDIVRFKANTVTDLIFTSTGQIMYPEGMHVRSVIIDQRRRPVEYGPSPRNNLLSVNRALGKLNAEVE